MTPREENISEGITLGDSRINLLTYDDDIALLGNIRIKVKLMYEKLRVIGETVAL